MAITELKAQMQTADARRANMHSAERGESDDRIASLETEFRLLREECVRTRNLIEDREKKGRTLYTGLQACNCRFCRFVRGAAKRKPEA